MTFFQNPHFPKFLECFFPEFQTLKRNCNINPFFGRLYWMLDPLSERYPEMHTTRCNSLSRNEKLYVKGFVICFLNRSITVQKSRFIENTWILNCILYFFYFVHKMSFASVLLHYCRLQFWKKNLEYVIYLYMHCIRVLEVSL